MDYLKNVGLLCIVLLLLPLFMRGYLLHWKLRWGFPLNGRTRYPKSVLMRCKTSSLWVYIFLEFFLAFSILTSGLVVAFSTLSVWGAIGPHYFGTTVVDIRMDLPMTTGSFLFLVSTVGFPWLLFHYVGVPCIRDIHQLCKEALDALVTVSGKLSLMPVSSDSEENSG